MIIIEGPDGAGKSMLIKNLRIKNPELRLAVRPCSPQGGPMVGGELIEWLKNWGKRPGYVHDRHPCISGPVYDAVFSRPVDSRVQPWLQDALYWVRENARVIYCRPPRSAIVAAVNEHPQMKGVDRMIHQLIDTYDSIMGNMIPHERYDWTKDDLPSL